MIQVPVLDNWWQTETAHAITATCVGLGNTLSPPRHSSGQPVPGFDGIFLEKHFLNTLHVTISFLASCRPTLYMLDHTMLPIYM